MPSIVDEINATLAAPLGRLAAFPPLERILEGNAVNEALLEAQAAVAAQRRSAVHQLQAEGWTLKEIGDALGLKPQRIHQIENGYDRHERRDRAGR